MKRGRGKELLIFNCKPFSHIWFLNGILVPLYFLKINIKKRCLDVEESFSDMWTGWRETVVLLWKKNEAGFQEEQRKRMGRTAAVFLVCNSNPFWKFLVYLGKAWILRIDFPFFWLSQCGRQKNDSQSVLGPNPWILWICCLTKGIL